MVRYEKIQAMLGKRINPENWETNVLRFDIVKLCLITHLLLMAYYACTLSYKKAATKNCGDLKVAYTKYKMN